MTEPDPKALDELFNRVLDTEDGALTAAREAGSAAGMPAIEVSAQHGKLLFILATAMRATRVLEIGTLAGYSTIQLARGVRDMLEMMGENPRLDAAAIQTVGTKGWDGFAVAIVKDPAQS